MSMKALYGLDIAFCCLALFECLVKTAFLDVFLILLSFPLGPTQLVHFASLST